MTTDLPLTETSSFALYEKRIEDLKKDYLKKHPEWIKNAIDHDPALNGLKSPEATPELKEIMLMPYPGLTAIAAHEEANKLYHEAISSADISTSLSKQAEARWISETAKTLSGIDIHPGATIASDCFFDHGTGLVIGETAIVGKGSFSLHGVTLGGSTLISSDDRVAGGSRRHPAIGDNVTFGSNVGIYGACTIGNDVQIHTGARLIDCEVGDGAVIGHGVDLRGAVIPAGAKIYNQSRPLVVVYDPEHQGTLVMARSKDGNHIQTPQEAATTPFKQAITSEYLTPDEVANRKSVFERLYLDAKSAVGSAVESVRLR
jgi:serine O-acetyltransferase